MIQYPVRIQHEDDGTIVIVDAAHFVLFHIAERSHQVEALAERIIDNANEGYRK